MKKKKNKLLVKLKKKPCIDVEKVPPCITQWKNKKGYMISLEKRLSSLQEDDIEINIEAFKLFNEELDKIEEEFKKK